MKSLPIAIAAFLLAATSAGAADIVVDPQRFETGNYNWTGFYAGAAISTTHVQDWDPRPQFPGHQVPWYSEGSNDQAAYFAGYMFQSGSFVLGLEYEYSNLDIQYISEDFGPIPVFVTDSHSGLARAGVAVDRFQFYGVGGATWVDSNVNLDDWMLTWGVGVDVAVTDNVIIGGRYDNSHFEDFDGTGIVGDRSRWSVRAALKF